MSTDVVSVRTLDGLRLSGTLVRPAKEDGRPKWVAVLVHGGGVTREEGGFFARLADGLAETGTPSLRFDLRGHGDSQGRQEELTLASILNDIHVVTGYAKQATEAAQLVLVGASFGGGICGYYAAKRSEDVDRLVLLNPQLDYKRRTIDSRPYWADGVISDDMARELNERGAIQFTPTLRHGRPLLNEVFWLKPHEALGEIGAPTLLVHGTADTLVPFASSRDAVERFNVPCTLVPVEGAQHGFAVHDDPHYLNPRSIAYQTFVIGAVREWLGESSTEPSTSEGDQSLAE
ncbi:alpha/beta hydrolase [Streptomyces sp. NPDC090306]|uniref:alpha/beta hydrolase n=1 Tax=Streptomyces sp. NPDC090306 TaxID=3365961 RepID=UPI00382E2390